MKKTVAAPQPCRCLTSPMLQPHQDLDGQGGTMAFAWGTGFPDPIVSSLLMSVVGGYTREDPMKLEAALSWSPPGRGGRVASPEFCPSAAWLASPPPEEQNTQGSPVEDLTTGERSSPLDLVLQSRPSLLIDALEPITVVVNAAKERKSSRGSVRIAAKKGPKGVGAAQMASQML